MIPGAALMLAVILVTVLKRNYRRETYRRNRKKIRRPAAVFCGGLYLADRYRKRNRPTAAELEIREIYRVSAEEEEVLLAVRFADVLALLFFAAFCTAGSDALRAFPSLSARFSRVFGDFSVSPYIFTVFGAAAALWRFIYPSERLKEKLKKRKETLADEYPGFVLKLSMFLQAGLSTRLAWERILRDEEKLLKEREGKKRKKRAGGEKSREERKKAEEDPLISEMRFALHSMEQGLPEKTAYLEFGRRCGLASYRRIGSYLARNLRQGLRGADEALAAEIERALEEKKNTALRRGEEAGTKLLFPMMLLFGVVLAVLVIPAFMMLL